MARCFFPTSIVASSFRIVICVCFCICNRWQPMDTGQTLRQQHWPVLLQCTRACESLKPVRRRRSPRPGSPLGSENFFNEVLFHCTCFIQMIDIVLSQLLQVSKILWCSMFEICNTIHFYRLGITMGKCINAYSNSVMDFFLQAWKCGNSGLNDCLFT